MSVLSIFLYGIAVGWLFGFAFAVTFDEIRLKRVMKGLKNEKSKK